jgi:hypothetical protein
MEVAQGGEDCCTTVGELGDTIFPTTGGHMESFDEMCICGMADDNCIALTCACMDIGTSFSIGMPVGAA